MSPFGDLPIELILHIADYLYFPDIDYLALIYPRIFHTKRYRKHKRFRGIVRCLRPFGPATKPDCHVSDRHFPTTVQDIRSFALTTDLAYYTTCLDLVTPTSPYLTIRNTWSEDLDKPRGITWHSEDVVDELRLRRSLQRGLRKSCAHRSSNDECDDADHRLREFSRADFLRGCAMYATFPSLTCLMLSIDATAVPDDAQVLPTTFDDGLLEDTGVQKMLAQLQHVRFTSRHRRTRDRVLDLMEFFAGLPSLHTIEIGQVDLALPGAYEDHQPPKRSQSIRCIVFRESEVAIDWVYSMARLLTGPCHIFRTSFMSDRIANPSWGHLEIPYKDAPQGQWKLELGAYATLPEWALQLLHRCDDPDRYRALG